MRDGNRGRFEGSESSKKLIENHGSEILQDSAHGSAIPARVGGNGIAEGGRIHTYSQQISDPIAVLLTHPES